MKNSRHNVIQLILLAPILANGIFSTQLVQAQTDVASQDKVKHRNPSLQSITQSASHQNLIIKKQSQRQSQRIETKNVQKSFWDMIRDIFRQKRREGGTKGDTFCTIAPNITSSLTWSDRPLFLWQGSATRIEIRRTPTDLEPIWSHQIAEDEYSLVYQGPSLDRGSTYYYWIEYESVLSNGNTVLESTYMPLKLLDSERYEQIKTELEAIAQDSEAIHNRVRFFVERSPILLNSRRDLFLDIVRELFSGLPTEQTWDSERQSIRDEFCS